MEPLGLHSSEMMEVMVGSDVGDSILSCCLRNPHEMNGFQKIKSYFIFY